MQLRVTIPSACQWLVAVCVTAAAVFLSAEPTWPDETRHRFITIGTGPPGGIYHAFGGALCDAVNRQAERQELQGRRIVTSCRSGPSGGSAFNVRQVVTGAFTFAIVQANVQQVAFSGGNETGIIAAPELRAVFSIHDEVLHLVVSKDSNVSSFDGLRGRDVSAGNVGSGAYDISRRLAAAHGLASADVDRAVRLTPEAQTQALCSGELDAFLWVSAAPSHFVTQAIEECAAVLLTLDGPVEKKLARRASTLFSITIPETVYPPFDVATTTLGTRAGLVTREVTPDDVVQDVIDAMLHDIDLLRAVHPALKSLDPAGMATEGLGAPLHDAAAQLFTERQLK